MHIVCFQGGFANQLFQFCLYLKIKEMFPKEKIYAGISKYKKCDSHGGFRIGNFYDIPVWDDDNILSKCKLIDEDCFFTTQINENDDYYYYGYWQDEKFFPENMSPVYDIFNKLEINEKNAQYLKEVSETESVSVHVRRGDYVNNYLHGNIANRTYYQNAIENISGRVTAPVFFVFSDDINWCKENLSFEDNKVIYITGNEKDVHYDMLIMSRCKHNIISNSSFSWWAQRLNQNTNRIVYAPTYWFNENGNGIKINNCECKYIRNVPEYKKTVENPFFSFLVPVYNKQYAVRRCLASILNQTFTNFEVIIVDDGSSDESFNVISDYAALDSRVKIIKHECNQSLLVSRISAMKEAKGKYVIFVDSDDYISDSMCETLHNTICIDEYDIVQYKYIMQPSMNIGREYPIPDDYVKASLMYEYSHTLWDKCYSKKLIDFALQDMDEFYCNMSEDAYFTSIFYYYSNTVKHIDDILYYYVDLGGMTAENNVSLESMIRNCDSIDAKSNHLKKFYHDKNIDYDFAIDYSTGKQIEFMRTIATKDSVPIHRQLELLSYLDERYNTSYAKDMDFNIKNLLAEQKKYKSMGRKDRFINGVKNALKGLKGNNGSASVKTLFICLFVLTLAFCVFNLLIMPSDSSNLGGKHAWISASTIKFTNMWLEEGPVSLHFTNYEAFPSIELPDMNAREPYVSYPTGETFMVWLAAKVVGKNHIDVAFLKHYQKILFGIENAMLMILIYFFLSRSTGLSEKTKSLLTCLYTGIWMTFPINNWFLTNIFWTDIAVLFWVIAFILLDYLCDYKDFSTKLRKVLSVLRIPIIYAGIMTEYYFWLVVFFAFIIRIVKNIIISKKFKFIDVIKDSLIYVIPVLLGIGTIIWQMSFTEGWINKLTDIFAVRTGATHEYDVWPNLLKNISVSIVCGSRLKAAALICVELIFAICLIYLIIKKYKIKGLLSNDNFGLMFMLAVSPIIQILVFNNHSAIHQYAMTKLSLQVVGCLLGVSVCCLKIFCNKKVKSINIELLIIALLTVVTLFSLGYPERVTGFYEEDFKKADYTLAEIVADKTNYNDVCFSFSYSVPLMPPMDYCVSEKMVYSVNSVEEAYTMFPDLPQEANLLLIVDKTGEAGNIYDKIKKTEEMYAEEEKIMKTHEILYEDDLCAIVKL